MEIWKNNITKKIVQLNTALIIAVIIIILIKYSTLPSKVPLFYGRPWGNDQLALKNFLFLIPALSIAFLLIQVTLSNIFFKKNNIFLAFLTVNFSLLFSLFGIITLVNIILLIS